MRVEELNRSIVTVSAVRIATHPQCQDAADTAFTPAAEKGSVLAADTPNSQ